MPQPTVLAQVFGGWRCLYLAARDHRAVQHKFAEGHWDQKQFVQTWQAWRQGLVIVRQERQLERRQEEQWRRVQGWLREHKTAAEPATTGKGSESGVCLGTLPSFKEHMGAC